MTFEIHDRDLPAVKEALWLGQEALQARWERSLALNEPIEEQRAKWQAWSDARYTLLRLNLIP